MLRRAQENQDEWLAFVNYAQGRVLAHARAKIFDLFFEGRLAIEVFEQDILVCAIHEGNQLERSAEGGPCGIEIARVVANGLVLNAECARTIGEIFLRKPRAVKDATRIVSKVAYRGIEAHIFHPGNVLP